MSFASLSFDPASVEPGRVVALLGNPNHDWEGGVLKLYGIEQSAADAVLAGYTAAVLPALRTEAKAEIDRAAISRAESLSKPWYASKYSQAVYALQGDQPSIDALAAEAQIRGVTVPELATTIVANNATWAGHLAAISAQKTAGFLEIDAATAPETIAAAKAATIATIEAIG